MTTTSILPASMSAIIRWSAGRSVAAGKSGIVVIVGDRYPAFSALADDASGMSVEALGCGR